MHSKFSQAGGDIEIHSVEGIRECFANGIDPNGYFKNEPLINELTSEYLRSSRFKDCVKAFTDCGLVYNDKAINMLHFLLAKSATVKHHVTGLIWGKGYDRETLIPSVNPISYAMMGLLPQMHRREAEISGIVSLLLSAGYEIDYQSTNIPNKYLHP